MEGRKKFLRAFFSILTDFRPFWPDAVNDDDDYADDDDDNIGDDDDDPLAL